MKEKKNQKITKRFFDIVISLFILVPFLPLWLLVAIIIKTTSPGPIFFLQERPGLHKKIFKVYKFRTMRPGSGKMIKGQEVMRDDNRITKIGKFLRRSKIDEIPQVLNVLKGEMSLVGPRPERIASLKDYTDEISKRLNMRPGLTGLAQVSGNIYLTLQDRYKFDVYYVENFSMVLDVKIILRTIGVVLFGEDRYVDKYLVDVNKSNNEVAATNEETVSNEKDTYNRG
ncbi:sugar transferase [Halobacillus sp. K22]|uniref:sugar transferase n=1 Tax=Halobacillus sp. K22 TaxID=3457431 RepID=UPI003FCE28FB